MTDAKPFRWLWAVRLLCVALALVAWFGTQKMLGDRVFAHPEQINDGLFELTKPYNEYLNDHPSAANALLIVSSAVIDILGVFLLARSVFGPTIRPFLGLLILFGMRQVCQMLCALPAPDGIIWRPPGFPSLLVTYSVASDFFFSGHTGIAVLGAMELARTRWRALLPLAWLIAAFEASTVILLRAHYTMDVVAGALAALVAAQLAARWSPWIDRLLQPAPRPQPPAV